MADEPLPAWPDAEIKHISAFSDGARGGNPAGVLIARELPPEAEMQALAAKLGYSETVFAAPLGDGWRVRYFAPQREVAFCGHATIALGAELVRRFGAGRFSLTLNHAAISVEGAPHGELIRATLVSPPTRSRPASPEVVRLFLHLFSLTEADLDPRLPPGVANGGMDHLVLTLADRTRLAAMDYDLEAGRALMNAEGLVTISLVFVESPTHFHARNAFASGGVLEDPATGAAAAALGGYLRDLGWPHEGRITILQGEDMGMPSRLEAEVSPQAGSPIRVGGTARFMTGVG